MNDELSKREMFAAMAMQAIIALEWNQSYDKIACWSVEMADALIKSLGGSQVNEQGSR